LARWFCGDWVIRVKDRKAEDLSLARELLGGKEVAVRNYSKRVAICATFITGLFFLTLAVGYAEESSGLKGWEKGSDYNKLYNLDEWDDFKGYVVGFTKIIPLPGMAPGVALLVRDRDSNEIVTVHLGPRAFVNPNSVGVRKGERVKVKGVWAEIKGKEVFLAAKVKKGDHFEYKLRLTKDGTPFWTMSPEEMSRESEDR